MSLTMRKVLAALAWRPRVGRLARTLLAACGMGLSTWLAKALGAPLSVLVLVACATYPALLLAVGALTREQLRAVMRREPI
jgi:hypothetical protein